MRLRSLAASAFCLGLLQAFVVPPATATTVNAQTSGERRIWMTVAERRFAVTLQDNEAALAFVAQLPLALDMPDLNGNEKHVRVPRLPSNVTPAGTIHAGDVMLYGDDTLVVFYETFRSSYSYTRIGRIEQPARLAHALGQGTARITFTAP